MYVNQIKDFSAKELRPIFDIHISETANITTDLWRGYNSIPKEYNIKQIPSNTGKNFKILLPPFIAHLAPPTLRGGSINLIT